MASRKDEKEQRRQERLAREQAEQAHNKRRRLYAVIVGAVLAGAAAVAIVIALVAGGGGDSGNPGGVSAQGSFPDATDPPAQKLTDLDAVAKAANCVLRNPTIEGNTHITDSTKVVYKTKPPTSGNHNPVPAEDGYYSQRPSRRHSTHALEHGRIYVQYRPTLAPARIKQLGGLFNSDSFHMLLSPNRDMPYQVAVTAWGHIAGCKKVTDQTFDVLRAFRDRYRDRGPESVP